MKNKMKDKKLQIGLEDIHNISMTTLEKERLLENILSSYPMPKQPIRSPWTFFSFTSKLQNRFVYYGVVPVLIIILFTSGTVFASQNSLPGDLLYPIKVGVVEPIHSALISSKVIKAAYQASLATKRLMEAEALANNGKLDEHKQQEINKTLASNILSFNKTINSLDQSNATKNVDNLVTDFQANMNAHAQVLDTISSTRDISIQTESFQISKTARDNAGMIIDNFKNNRKNNRNTSDKYIRRKDQIQSLIDSTTTNLLDKMTNETSPTEQTIVNDTKKTLDQAKQFLDEADNKNNNSDSKDAYSSLLDSESAAKQANIFLKSELKFKKGNENNIEKEKNH